MTFECELCGSESWTTMHNLKDNRRSEYLTCEKCAKSVVACFARGQAPKSHWRSLVKYEHCAACRDLFVQRGNRRTTCSPSCSEVTSNRRSAARITSLYSAATSNLNPHQAAQWRLYLINYLRQRDSDRCTLCGFSIDFTVKSGPSGSPWGASIDHITPKSNGGSDNLNNLALTHWRCNHARRAQNWKRVA